MWNTKLFLGILLRYEISKRNYLYFFEKSPLFLQQSHTFLWFCREFDSILCFSCVGQVFWRCPLSSSLSLSGSSFIQFDWSDCVNWLIRSELMWRTSLPWTVFAGPCLEELPHPTILVWDCQYCFPPIHVIITVFIFFLHFLTI